MLKQETMTLQEVHSPNGAHRVGLYFSGLVLPRIAEPISETGSRLISLLWEKYSYDFINYIKGCFVVYIKTDNESRVYTDHLGLSKVFFRYTDSLVRVSSNMFDFTHNEVSAESFAVFSVMYHHTGGLSPFKDIRYLKPGHFLRITDKLEEVEYWNSISLISSRKDKISSEDISERFYQVVNAYIRCLKPKSVGLTLTGGYDSRIILAALLKNGVETVAYTYGNPDSIDNFIAEKISMEMGVKHLNYDLNTPSPKQIDDYSRFIARESGGLATIHRMHRLYAVQEFIGDVPETDLILTGHMGGEVMKGIFFDDLITSPYVRRRWNKENKETLLHEVIDYGFIRENSVSYENVNGLIDQEKYWGNDVGINHFLFSIILKAGLHHSQDIGLINRDVAPCFPVFVDIDFLELLLKSKYSMLYNESRMRNPFKRIHAYEINCSMIKDLYPPLTKIPLGKRGMFTPEEYFGNKMILILKRASRYKQNRGFKSNYSIGEWLKDYIASLLPQMMHSELSGFIDFKLYSEELTKLTPGLPEKHWLRFTNAALYYSLIRERNEV